MSEIVRPRLNEEQMKEQIDAVKAIATLTASIKVEAEKMQGKTCKTAFLNSVINLEKKCEIYGKERATLSPDEKRVMQEAAKEALANFRANKEVPVSEVPEATDSVKPKRKH